MCIMIKLIDLKDHSGQSVVAVSQGSCGCEDAKCWLVGFGYWQWEWKEMNKSRNIYYIKSMDLVIDQNSEVTEREVSRMTATG